MFWTEIQRRAAERERQNELSNMHLWPDPKLKLCKTAISGVSMGRNFWRRAPIRGVCRSYYRCWDSNCDVKKTVERDAHDKGIVITTYLGTHNHESPTVIYYIERPEMHQASASTPNFQLGMNGNFFHSL